MESYAAKHEKQLIKEVDPKLADYIKWLEDGVLKFGTVHAKRYSKWGEQAKMTEIESQQMITEFFKDNPDLLDINKMQLVGMWRILRSRLYESYGELLR